MSIHELYAKVQQLIESDSLSIENLQAENASLLSITRYIPNVEDIVFVQPATASFDGAHIQISSKSQWSLANDVEVNIAFDWYDDEAIAQLVLQLFPDYVLALPIVNWAKLSHVIVTLQARSSVQMQHPLILPVAGSIGGTVWFQNTPIPVELAIEYADTWRIRGDFSSIELPSISDLLHFLGIATSIDLPPGLDGLSLVSLRAMSAEFSIQSDSVSAIEVELGSPSELGQPWMVISNLLSVDSYRVKLTVLYPFDGEFRHFRGRVTVLWVLGSKDHFSIELEAAYVGLSSGWQFEGSTGPDQVIYFGTLIAALTDLFGDISVPAAIADLNLEQLHVSFETTTKDFTFTCRGTLPIDNILVDATIYIDLQHLSDGTFKDTFSGHILIDELQFDLVFSRQPEDTIFLAIYQDPSGGEIVVKKMVALVAAGTAANIPDSLIIILKSALFAYHSTSTGISPTAVTKLLFGLDIGGGIDLSGLPLVGHSFPPEKMLRLVLQPTVATQAFSMSDLSALAALLPAARRPCPYDLIPKATIKASLKAPIWLSHCASATKAWFLICG